MNDEDLQFYLGNKGIAEQLSVSTGDSGAAVAHRPTIYRFFDRMAHPGAAECLVCRRVLKMTGNQTRSLHRHLQALHPDQWRVYQESKHSYAEAARALLLNSQLWSTISSGLSRT